MQEINGKTIVGKAEFMLKVDNLIDRYAPMSLDNLIETLEVEFNQTSEDLLVFEKPLEFKKLVENRSRKLFTSAADTIYNSTAEFELLYTFDEFLEVCAVHFALDSYELTRFEDCDASYRTNEDGNILIETQEDYGTFCLDYCNMGVDGSEDPDVDMAYFQFEKETVKGYDDLKGRWFNVVHGMVVFI